MNSDRGATSDDGVGPTGPDPARRAGTSDIEVLREQLRVAEHRRALAEAQLALARVAPAPSSDVPAELTLIGPALDVLFQSAAVTMVLLSHDGTILRANAAAADLWGLPVHELVGRRTSELTAPEDIADTEDPLTRSHRGQFLLKTYVRPDGTRVPAIAVGWPLVDDDGNQVCLVGVAVPLRTLSVSPSMLDQVLAHGRAAVSRDELGDERSEGDRGAGGT